MMTADEIGRHQEKNLREALGEEAWEALEAIEKGEEEMIKAKRMKAISLWQPWASLVATGGKKWETRHWYTRYRGPLLIHAAKRKVKSELMDLLSLWSFQGGLGPILGYPLSLDPPVWHGIKPDDLPFGAIIGRVDMTDCRRTDDLTQAEIGTDKPFGNFSLGRFAWRFENAGRFEEPVLYRGTQGFFDVPEELVKLSLIR